LLPGIIRRILNRKLEDIPGLDNIRDFLDSRDVCSMLVTLALLPKTSTSLHEVINLCSGKGTSIREIVNTILQQSDQENSEYITQRFNKQNDSTESISRLIGSNVKIRELVGNTVQKIPITETIKEALSLEKNR
jgi:nucleoside-diphosphate-sugar epimerase